jgi:hypothetical protein
VCGGGRGEWRLYIEEEIRGGKSLVSRRGSAWRPVSGGRGVSVSLSLSLSLYSLSFFSFFGRNFLILF